MDAFGRRELPKTPDNVLKRDLHSFTAKLSFSVFFYLYIYLYTGDFYNITQWTLPFFIAILWLETQDSRERHQWAIAIYAIEAASWYN